MTTQLTLAMMLAVTLRAAHPEGAQGVNQVVQPLDRRSALTLLLYDYAALPDGAIRAMERRTGEILSRVGIRVEWVQCRGPRLSPPPKRCSDKLESGHVVFRILPQCAERDPRNGDVLGLAVTPGAYISVCADRVTRLEKDNSLDRGSVMPYVAAHEIGHLLLGPDHGPQGVMRAVWGKAELSAMERILLNFSPGEAESMRRTVSDLNRPEAR